ncbi:Deoxyribose operon repressor [subsurface metagenome]
MDKNQRIKDIINILRIKNVANIKDLTKKLNVSEMTIRRDLNLLSNDNIVELIPGGAIFKPPFDSEREEEKYLITHEETRRIREKIKIGKKAASLIEPNDTVIIDVGSTTEYLAKFMPEDITVIILCYALNILVEIYRKRNCSPIFSGGYFHNNTLMFESPEGINLIRRTRADKAFVSAAGIHADLGVTCANPYELETKKAVLSSSKTKILLVDSSKFHKTKIAYFADLKDFDMVITDSDIPEDYKHIIRDLGIELVAV